MTSFVPSNLYTFAAARGQFLRPDVRALLQGPVGPFSNFANPRDPALRAEAERVRERLNALLFPVDATAPAKASAPAGGSVRRQVIELR
jgi:hypothetical protein